MRVSSGTSYLFLLLFVAISALFLAIVLFGPVIIPLSSIIDILFDLDNSRATPLIRQIFWEIRFSKALTALLAGASLSVCGLVMQTYFQNPLAGPFVLGIHGGSSLGVALWIMASATVSSLLPPLLFDLGTVFAAFAGGMAVLILLIFLSVRIPGKIVLLVFGLLFGHLTSGIINILIAISDAREIKSFLLWTLGSFQKISSDQLLIFSTLTTMGLISSFLMVKYLNVMLMGDNYAKSLGLPLVKTKLLLIILTALLSGTVTAFCGPVVFIGIVSPHVARWAFNSSDHRVLIPASMMIGSAMALLAEFIASYGEQIVLPLNAVTGLMGTPIIFLFLWKHRKEETI